MKRSLIITEDGSHSLRVDALGETYHSVHGALQESLHVYINNGLLYCPERPLHVFEMGFGTGLNALLTAQHALEKKQHIYYTALEAYPLEVEEWKALRYNELTGQGALFDQLHEADWETPVVIHPYFQLTKKKMFWHEFNSDVCFDLVYYDAFGADYQPELWSEDNFEKIHTILHTNGVMITYASRGIMHRALKKWGFNVEKLAGPPGKRQITRATKR